MDNNSWRPAQGSGEPTMDTVDWRTQLQPDSRQRIVSRIMNTLKRHLPFSGQEGLQELKKIAIRFEEKNFTAATSQSDYLRKISLKMLTMETKSQNTMSNSLPSNAANNSKNLPDTEEGLLQAEMGESAHLATQGRRKNAVKHKGKGKIPAQADIKKQSTCFFCKKKGHMKKDCVKHKAWLEKKGLPKP